MALRSGRTPAANLFALMVRLGYSPIGKHRPTNFNAFDFRFFLYVQCVMTQISFRKGNSVLDSVCSPKREPILQRVHVSNHWLYIIRGNAGGICLLGWVHWCGYCCGGWKNANRKLPKERQTAPYLSFHAPCPWDGRTGTRPSTKKRRRTDWLYFSKIWSTEEKKVPIECFHEQIDIYIYI